MFEQMFHLSSPIMRIIVKRQAHFCGCGRKSWARWALSFRSHAAAAADHCEICNFACSQLQNLPQFTHVPLRNGAVGKNLPFAFDDIDDKFANLPSKCDMRMTGLP